MTAPATVVVIDDDAAVCDSLTALLESDGYRVRSFSTAAAFLAAYEPDIGGCVLVDVRMPGMSGLELQRVLAERSIKLPLIIMTGHGDIPMAVTAMKAGAVDFVEKPFADDRILDCVARALARPAMAPAADPAALERVRRLSDREREVLEQLVIGHPNKVIAHNLSISPRTVEIHRARVMSKMEARSLSELVRLALASGFAGARK